MTYNDHETIEIAITFDGEPPSEGRSQVLYPATIDEALDQLNTQAKPWDIPTIWTRKIALTHTAWQEWDT